MLPPTSRRTAGRWATPTSTGSPTGSRPGLVASRRRRGRRPRARAAARTRVPDRLSRRSQGRCDHDRGQRPAGTDRARRDRSRSPSPLSCSPRPGSRRRRRRDRSRSRARASASTTAGRSCRPTPTSPNSRDDPDRPVAIIFTSGTTGLPKGALYADRQLEFITATDVGGTLGRRDTQLHRHVVRAPRVHDQAARQPLTRRHHVHHAALARARLAGAARAGANGHGRGRAHANSPSCSPTRTSTGSTSNPCASSSWAAARSHPVSRPRLGRDSVPRSRRGTRAPKRASDSELPSTTRRRMRS